MKRFLVFGFDNYYPCGGLNDLIGRVDTIEEARAMVTNTRYDFSQILDLETGEEIGDIDNWRDLS